MLYLLAVGKVSKHQVAECFGKERPEPNLIFLNRYKEPDLCLDYAGKALDYVHDSLPEYVDGELRALNNMAFAYYQVTDYEEATKILEQVEKKVKSGKAKAENSDIELVIARLLKARLLQRSCHIADSYELLYDIGKSDILEDRSGTLLYNYAQTEYYITLLTLNFHYRNGKEADVMSIIDDIDHAPSRSRIQSCRAASDSG